jgi:F0F1-type ATP synthase assembly protein I
MTKKERPPLIVALEWVNKITTFGFLMALPVVAGWWFDGRFGTKPWCLVVGAVLGFVGSLTYLIRIVQPPDSRSR